MAASYIVRGIKPTGESSDRLYEGGYAEQAAKDEYDDIVTNAAPRDVARVVLYRRGVSVPLESHDIRETGERPIVPISGPEPINTEGRVTAPEPDAGETVGTLGTVDEPPFGTTSDAPVRTATPRDLRPPGTIAQGFRDRGYAQPAPDAEVIDTDDESGKMKAKS